MIFCFLSLRDTIGIIFWRSSRKSWLGLGVSEEFARTRSSLRARTQIRIAKTD